MNSKQSIWKYFNDKQALPRQGWKIHISAHLGNYKKILNRLSPYLLENNIPFKVAKNSGVLEKLNIGLYGNSQVGKYMTIYALGNVKLIAQKCMELCEGFESPIIPSDKRIGKSIVYYRYGIISPEVSKEEYLLTPDGEYIKDQRVKKTAVPTWKQDPFIGIECAKLPKNMFFIKTLRQRGRGGVYLGIYNKEQVIIKESRPFGEYINEKDNGKLRLENEVKCLRELSELPFTPNLIAVEDIEEYKFGVMTKVSGISLKEFILKQNNLADDLIDELTSIIRIQLEQMHKKGIYHCDLNPDNIILAEKVYFIDFEHAVIENKDKSYKAQYGTKSFYPAYQDKLETLDIRELIKRDFYGLEMIKKAMRNPAWYKEIVNA